jgi:nucleotide-binding universal stress UspA family protein
MNGRIERVVVPLDAAAENRLAIETAARLAARAKALLHGVFVEDEELFSAAGLRFTRQSTLGADAEPFTVERTALELRAAAERARRELAAVAEQRQVTWSFEIVRGPAERVFDSATARDLVVAGGLTRPVAGHFRVEPRWFASMAAAPGPFLLARHGWDGEGGVAILLRDRNPRSVRLIEAAAQIAEARGGSLIVIRPPTIADAAALADWLAERLSAYAVNLRIEIAPAEPAVPDRRIVELGCRLLAIAASEADGIAAQLRDLAERFAYDILVVR